MKLTLGEVLQGPAGTATEVILKGTPDRPAWVATLGMWFLSCPGQSPAWDKYLLSIIHLRPIDGVPDADISVPNATHEVLLIALNPDRNPTALDMSSWQHLTPANLVEQIELPNDEDAKDLLKKCATAVVNGMLWAEPPLSGQKEPWRTVLIKTAAHYRGEEHAP